MDIKMLNKVMEKRRLLQYTGFAWMAPLLFNLRHRINKELAIAQLALVITSFIHHRYKKHYTLVLDNLVIYMNLYLVLTNFNYRISMSDSILLLLTLGTPICLYTIGYFTKKYNFDPKFGYVIHALCHFSVSIMYFIVLKNIRRNNIIKIMSVRKLRDLFALFD